MMQTIEDFKAQYEGIDLYFQFDRIYLGDNKVVYSCEHDGVYLELSTWPVRLHPAISFLSRHDCFTVEELQPYRIDVYGTEAIQTVYLQI
jgi:hypothetical protein